MCDFLALEEQPAVLGLIQPVDAVHHARLAGSVGADDRKDLSLPHLEADVRESRDPVERKKYVPGFQYDFRHSHPLYNILRLKLGHFGSVNTFSGIWAAEKQAASGCEFQR
jgi:hypothetical protein